MLTDSTIMPGYNDNAGAVEVVCYRDVDMPVED